MTVATLSGDTAVHAAAVAAAATIPPAWPLAATVAVNPWLGQAGEGLAVAAARMARVAGIRMTPERSAYQARIASGAICDADLRAALAAADGWRPADLAALKAAVAQPSPAPVAIPTVAELAADVSGIDWPAIIEDRFGDWAAGWFDQGQALWAAPHSGSAYADWRLVATHDLTPEVMGLTGFAAQIAAAPTIAGVAIATAAERLGLADDALTNVFHRALTTLGGWAQAARYLQWQANLAGSDDATIIDFLAIRLLWDAALHDHYRPQIEARW